MNEFWNLVFGQIAAFIVGMATHSALGHSYGNLMRNWFHPKQQLCPLCGSTDLIRVNVCRGCYERFHRFQQGEKNGKEE